MSRGTKTARSSQQDVQSKSRVKTQPIGQSQDMTRLPVSDGSQVDPTALSTEHLISLQGAIGNHAINQLITHNRKELSSSAGSTSVHGTDLQITQRIQRFDSDEHMGLGDEATSGKHGETQTVELADGYRVTYGEMVAMAGDYFESIAQMRELAANTGTGPGTREEIEFVRVVEIHRQKDKAETFSEGVEDTVMSRYYALAGGNRSHFLNPVAPTDEHLGDEELPVDERNSQVETQYVLEWKNLFSDIPQKQVPQNAGAGYRLNHFQALYEAWMAGATGQSIDSAMAVEAFGNHYLTDSFAGGHVRTARASINDHWNERVPMFSYNLKGFIAEKLAEELEKTTYKGMLSEEAVYSGVLWWAGALETVTELIESKGSFTFGDIIAGAIHDYDNHYGVAATIPGASGQEVRLFGDGHLGEGDEQEFAIDAIRLSREDVQMAWTSGANQESPLILLAQIMQDDLFAAEHLLPQTIPDSELPEEDRRPNWEVETVAELFEDQKFVRGLEIFAEEKAKTFKEVAEGLDEEAKRVAFTNQIINPLKAEPVTMIREVIDWTPNTGGGIFGHNQDDNAMDYFNAAKDKGALSTLSYKQKKALIGNLLDGATIGDEEDAIMEILKANPDDARKLIDEFGWDRLESNIDDGWGSEFADAYSN